ncbi:MAG: hypothetical protein E7588_10045 [Ruminococcaceae bacterium]|nr:hypothetical protein [Oscillospiraceae bacterium]
MTAQKIYQAALELINERDENGELCDSTGDFEKNAPGYLSILTISLYELDCRIKGVSCNIDDDNPPSVKSLEDEITLHSVLCRGVLPYGLAFMLLLEEEPSRAEKFRMLYENAVYNLEKMHLRGQRKNIKDVY